MLDRSCGVPKTLNMRNILILLLLAMLISIACATESKGLIGKIIKESEKVGEAQLSVMKYAIKDGAVLMSLAANAML